MTTPIARALFGRLFDNAAMYPPAKAPMEASIALHDAAERAPWGFARGRFLCPGARLDDLAHDLRVLGRDRKALRVGAVIGSPADVNERPPLDAVVRAINHLRLSTPAVHVDLFEVRPHGQGTAELTEAVHEAAEAAASSGADTVFMEIAVAGQPTTSVADGLAAIGEAGRAHGLRIGAKVRCGGLEPGMVPTRAELANFLHGAREHGLAFKATAGLHHAFSDVAGGRIGFVSLLLASVFTQSHDLSADQVELLLAVAGPSQLRLTDDSVHLDVGDLHLHADVEQVTRARYRGFVAFGTCSFTEPAFDAARLLEDAA